MPTTDAHPQDVLRAADALASRPGTLLLHDGRPGGRRVLLFAPRWTLAVGGDAAVEIAGPAPSGLPIAGRAPTAWPTLLTEQLPRDLATDDLPWLAGFFTFEAGAAAHGVGAIPKARAVTPDVWLGAYDRALVQTGSEAARLVVRDLGPLDPSAPPLEERRAEALDQLAATTSVPSGGTTEPPDFLDRRWHGRAVATIGEHLRRGDVYQINLTGHASARSSVHPFEGFRRESRSNPTEFAAYLRLDDATITSHSPELLLRVRGDALETAPIKGTAPSGQEDALRASAKDRAEHVMIVDLCRNDLGRVAVPGSVRVDPLMSALGLRGLTHLVSHVHARLDRRHRHDVLGALLPGGSISGAPKRRALEIVRSIETERRGPYTGTIGGIAPSGRQDWSIAIRTAVWQDGAVHFGCGGGIVLDSDPEREFEEARLKARSFFASLGSDLQTGTIDR